MFGSVRLLELLSGSQLPRICCSGRKMDLVSCPIDKFIKTLEFRED
jgi:hypothetical protein